MIGGKVHLLRLPNTRHGESGLLKIGLTPHELHTLSAIQIRALAHTPRPLMRVATFVSSHASQWPPPRRWSSTSRGRAEICAASRRIETALPRRPAVRRRRCARRAAP